MSEVLYAQVREATEVRREFLLSSKVILDELKAVDAYQSIRNEKEELITEFHRGQSQLARLVGRLRARLPKTDLKIKTPAPRPTHVLEQKVDAKPIVPRKTKLELLEQELSKIESKLQTLE